MRTRVFEFALTALFASLAAGQISTQPDIVRVFHFNQADTEQGLQEMTVVVQAIADMKIAADPAHGTFSLRGTADQVALAEWLLNQLDPSASRVRLPGSQTRSRGARVSPGQYRHAARA